MFIELKNLSNKFQDDIFAKYMPKSINISVAGIGETGSNAVNDCNIQTDSLEHIDYLTIFDFKTDSSHENVELCKNSCRNTSWLFVLVDLAEENAAELIEILLDGSRNVEMNTDRHIVCVTSEKYRYTDHEKRTKTTFDKIIYVEDSSLLFAPIEALFVHPMGYIGVDRNDYYGILEHSENIYSIRLENHNESSVATALIESVNNKLEKFNIRTFNAIIHVCHGQGDGLSILYELSEATSIYKLKNKADIIYNAVLRKDKCKSIITDILIC